MPGSVLFAMHYSEGDKQEANKPITQCQEVLMATKKYKTGQKDRSCRRSYFIWTVRDGLPEVTFEQIPK